MNGVVGCHERPHIKHTAWITGKGHVLAAAPFTSAVNVVHAPESEIVNVGPGSDVWNNQTPLQIFMTVQRRAGLAETRLFYGLG